MTVAQPCRKAEAPPAFRMPSDYRNWVEDVARIDQAITAMLYAHYALVEQNTRRHRRGRGDGTILSPDDVPVYDAVLALHDGIDGLQAVLVDAGASTQLVDRGYTLEREMHRVFHGNFTEVTP